MGGYREGCREGRCAGQGCRCIMHTKSICGTYMGPTPGSCAHRSRCLPTAWITLGALAGDMMASGEDEIPRQALHPSPLSAQLAGTCSIGTASAKASVS